ncbi:SPOR domain-containing protein [Ramlibacter sp.]|uniref:SPOR domain-containing protein n=1 Tax=Ramlibacter sp. TaxID=1917967 RepID=UPI0035B0C2AF
MALFKFRNKGAADAAPAPPVAESIEAMRRRARHRLIGAVVLVLIGVIGFPLLFDTQPRPVAVDIPIEIPDRNKAKPLPVPEVAPVTEKAAEKPAPAPQAPAVAAAPPAAPAASARPAAKAPAEADARPAAAPQAKVEPKPEPRPAAPKPEAKPPEPKPAEARAAPADDGARARALLEGREPEADAPGARFVVQVGAYGDADKAREARQKLERAGLKTYVHVADTKDGKRTRVRVGPFATRAEADRAAEKIKGLDLPAAILTL